MSSEERSFTSTELGTFIGFAVVGLLLGIGAYQIGGKLAGANGGAVVAPTTTADTNTPNGEALYNTTCAACHGPDTKGMPNLGVNLAVTVPWNEAQFKTAVQEGKAPDRTLTPVMPRFTQLKPEELNAIHAYIKNKQ